MTMPTTRRSFLGRAAGRAALLSAASALGGVHASADERPATLRLGLIGCGGIMGQHVRTIVGGRLPVSIAWLCDVDPRHIDRAAWGLGVTTPPRQVTARGGRTGPRPSSPAERRRPA